MKRLIKLLSGMGILILIQYICNITVKLLHIVLPAPILGMIILAYLLQMKIIKKEWVKDICEMLLGYMPLMFVPLLVGIIVYYPIIEKNFIPIMVNVIVTATLTLILTGIIVDNIIKYIRLRKIRKYHNE